jgi:gliding motility-associated-like protein
MRNLILTIFSTVFIVILSNVAFGVTASFTADYSGGCSPLIIHFTNTSTGATSYSWNLGNGSPVTAVTDPSGSYIAVGTYTVTLTASSGAATSTATMVVTVYPKPVPSFTASDTSICPNTTVVFNNTSSGGTPGPVTCTWNFGDGSAGAGSTPSHTYVSPGFYNVTLAVTNSQGCDSSITYPSYVHVYSKPIPTFSGSPTFFCNPPGTTTFTGSATGTGPFTYLWHFGDGTTGTGASPTHTYAGTGTYNVSMVVTDAHGCSDSLVRPAYITVTHLVASFTSPTSACVFAPVVFNNTSSAHSSSIWYFGDGASSPLDALTIHAYSAPGTYTVKLVISTGPCTDTVTNVITILPSPVASFTYTPVHPCPAPATIDFTATVPPGSTVTWNFGDGHTGTGTSPVNTYAGNGSYTPYMIVTNSSGCKDTVINNLNIYNLFLRIIDTPKEGCVPLTVPFQVFAVSNIPGTGAVYPYPYPIASYSWNFGDGSPTTTTATPTHTYTTEGVFTGTVTVTTANGCTATDTFTIKTGNKPIPNFFAMPTHICADHNVTFTSTSTGLIDQYQWTFGDGGGETDTIGSVVHHYLMPDTFYSVTLKVSYHGCDSIITKHHYITVDSPLAIARESPLCYPPATAAFGDSSIGETSHLWIFPDGTTSTADTLHHTFPTVGTYTVELTTYNSRSGCRDTTVVPVNLVHAFPHFTADDTAICRDKWVTFTPTITGGTAAGYYWYVNGVFMEDTAAVYKDTIHATGIYTVTLVILDGDGCFDTFTRNNYVLVAKPVSDFTAVPTSGCWPLTVTFTDVTTDVPGTFATSHAWTFGDGGSGTTTSSIENHTYTAAGTYGVTEIVTDNIGCKDTVTHPSLITVFRPHAVFTAATTTPCANQPDVFTNTSAGIVSSFWMFGDGDTSTMLSPTHIYTAFGTYTVKLVVTDAHGCVDTATYVNYIHVNQPVASFTMDDSLSICPPLTVHFTNTSINATSYQWYFGDGSSSTTVSPSDLYITASIFTVTLVASNAQGCVDTAIGHVNLLGYTGTFSYGPVLQGCSPLTIFFNAGTVNVPNVKWDFLDGTVSPASTTDTITHVYVKPGWYLPRLILSDNTGCQNSVLGVDTIKVDVAQPFFKTNPSPVCVNTNVSFIDSSYSYFSTVNTWLWTINGITSTISNPSYYFNTVGSFPVTLKVTDGWGCTGILDTTVTVYPPPTVTTSPDTVICLTDGANLVGYGAATYVWSPSATLSCTNCNPTMATPAVATQYTVVGTDIHGCVNSDTVSVFIKTKTFSVGYGAGVICQGDSLQLSDSGATQFSWTPVSSVNLPNAANPVVKPLSTTTYMVIAQLASCIPDTNYITVVVHPAATVNAGPDQTVVSGATAQIKATAQNADIISWSPAQTLSCDNCLTPIASMQVTTTYTVTVSTKEGCRASDSVTIFVLCDASQVFVPNTFTPNGDGKNDVFYPRGSGITAIQAFRVYNRWGELMFERTNININDESNAWDGSFGGEASKPDVYVWLLDATCNNGQQVKLKGDVTIIK